MSTLARQILGTPRKRKEPAESFKPPPKRREPPKPIPKPSAPKQTPKPSHLGRAEPEAPALQAKNQLLAGYLAHEFLTKGTLFGQPFDPARAEPLKQAAEPEQQPASYADLAYLLKFDGTHIPGIVNPTQLGCWIQKGGRLSS